MKKLLLILLLVLAPSFLLAGQVVVAVQNAHVRSKANGQSRIVKTVHKGDAFDLLDENKHGRYYKISLDGKPGYIYETSVDVQAGEPSSEATPTSNDTPFADTTPASTDTTPTVPVSTPEVFNVPNPFDGCGKDGDATETSHADANLNRLKNRDYTDLPGDYEPILLSHVFTLFTPQVGKGQKMDTWSADDLQKVQAIEKRAVSIQGYLLLAREEGKESCNCSSDAHQDHDFHVWLGSQPGDGSTTPDRSHAMVVEVSPRVRSVHPEWVLHTLLDLAKNQTPVRISGLLMYDDEHPEQLGKTRGTLWEIHPILKIEYQQDGAWIELK